MLERFLFVGTGGTGGKVLRHTWAQLDKWLRANNYTGSMPDGWRFVHIDLPENSDVVKGDVPMLAGTAIRYVKLAVAPRDYSSYDTQLLQMTGAPEALAGWRTDPSRTMPLPYDGAGQRRTVGNLVSLASQQQIRQAIAAEVTVLQSQETTNQLMTISQQLQLQIDAVPSEPTVVLVSSLGGGSGSGMFLNVIEMMMAMSAAAPWLQQRLYSVLFTPEALTGDTRAVAGDGMEPNSLAALSEFLHAFHDRDEVNPLDSHLFRAGGGGVASGPRAGRYNFFVGKSNGRLGFSSPPEVAKAIGKALAVLAADDAVRTMFQDYVGVNWSGQPVAPWFQIGATGANHNAATALGYASASLGRDVFARYAAERLARRALDRLLRGHREHDPTSTRRDERLIDERADLAQEAFFQASGLYELSEAHNDVLERLVDKDAMRARIAAAVRSVRESFSEDNRELTREDALNQIETRFADYAADVVRWAETHRFERMREWVNDIQDQLLDATAASIGKDGFAVTLELLNRLEQQAKDAANELDRDAGDADKRLRNAPSRLQAILSRVRDRITPQNENFRQAVGDREADLIDRVEGDLFRFAAVLLREVAQDLLPPLRQAVASAQAAIARSEQGAARKLVAEWSRRAVGTHILPAANELMLEPVDGFPDQLDELLMGLFEGGSADAESNAISEVISGRWQRTSDDDSEVLHQRLFDDPLSDWSPRSIGARAARFTLSLDIDGLLLASERWVRLRKGGVARHVGEDLGAWLNPEERALADERSDVFLTTLRGAIGLAAPLVMIGDAFMKIHGGATPSPAVAISRIPIGPGASREGRPDSEARRHEQVIDVLMAAGFGRTEAEGLCDPNASTSGVEVMSFLGSSVHPMVFASVTEPILARWESCSTPGERAAFWDFRRSRQLSSFVPVSRQIQRQLARGWLIATELGYVERLRGPWSQGALKIWAPNGWRPFPARLLGAEPSTHRDVFPALLESLPLAMLRVGRGGTQDIDAYSRLLELGAATDDQQSASELARWIHHDSFPDPVDRGVVHTRTAKSGADPDARAEQILENLEKARVSYHELHARAITEESSLTVDRRWEMREVMVGAIEEVSRLVETIKARPPMGDDDSDGDY